MDKSIKIRNSQAFIILILILGLLVVGLMFSIVMKPVNITYNDNVDKEDLQEEVYQTFFTRTRTIWIWLPVVAGIVLIFWAYIESHKRQGGY